LPRISRELAEWCVERRIRLLGVEPPSVADVKDLAEVTEIHRILLSGQIVIVEGLANLEAVRQERVLFGALPLKIEGGDGSPCRAFALEGVSWFDLGAASS
jgi:kynurenine formamidase